MSHVDNRGQRLVKDCLKGGTPPAALLTMDISSLKLPEVAPRCSRESFPEAGGLR
jgi:hypothetical protein